jgi:hypothetical protein
VEATRTSTPARASASACGAWNRDARPASRASADA